MLGLLHPLASRTRWSRSSTGTPRRARSSAAAPARASTSRTSAARWSRWPRAAPPPGPVSFMRGADAWAGTIKSGGKTRRAAKMVVLDVDHPDIRDFIWCKAKEEDKAAALRDAGFDMSIDGDGFHSIQYQNANNSVRVTDEFMHAVEDDDEWHADRARDRRAGRRADPRARADARDRRGRVALRRPGRPVRHDDQPVAHVARTRAASTRPTRAREYMHVDDSACNLASLNLMKFRRPDGTFDVERFEHAVDIVLPRAGDRRRPVELPDRGDRRQRARVPPARPRLRQPRRLPDGQRHAVRLRRAAAAPRRRSRR